MSKEYEDRRKRIQISDEQIEIIAERAAERAIERVTTEFYKSVGQTVISKALILFGAVFFGFYIWLKKQGLV